MRYAYLAFAAWMGAMSGVFLYADAELAAIIASLSSLCAFGAFMKERNQ